MHFDPNIGSVSLIDRFMSACPSAMVMLVAGSTYAIALHSPASRPLATSMLYLVDPDKVSPYMLLLFLRRRSLTGQLIRVVLARPPESSSMWAALPCGGVGLSHLGLGL